MILLLQRGKTYAAYGDKENAVLYKLKGLNEEAIKAFEKLFEFNINYIIPITIY